MDVNAVKAALFGLAAIGAMVVAGYMFLDFGAAFDEATAPAAQPTVPQPTREDCIEHNRQRREEIKRQLADVEDQEPQLKRGETATQNEAHREYLEKRLANEIQRLEKIYDDLQHETCE